MEAIAYDITDRKRPFELSFADVSDFSLERTGVTAAEDLLRNPDTSLYSLDFDEQRAVFVETPPSAPPREAAFYHAAQFENAIRVVTLPFGDFVELVDGQPVDDERLTFVFSVGRAGSTLASRLFAVVDGVRSVSEPDALTRLVAARRDPTGERRELQALLDACVRFLCAPEGAATWVIKGRSQVTAVGDRLHELYPRARKLFLYRDAESWLASARRAFVVGEPESPELQRVVERVSRTYLAPYTHLVAEYPEDRHLTAGELAALSWLSAMENAVKLVEAGVTMLPIRFSSWIARPEETAMAMLEYCGCRPSDPSSIHDVLERDSQAGTVLSRENTQKRDRGLQPGDLAELRRHLRRHDTIRSADFEIPGTLLPT